MKLTIVYDNKVFDKKNNLKSSHGFSCYIESNNNNILFDTGDKSNILLENMKNLNIDPEKIDKIVISHEHWDHNGGLKELICQNKNVEVYRLKKNIFPKKTKHITVEKPIKITEYIYSTGRLKGYPIDEQSLVIKGKKGGYVLAGCSHSGVKEILTAAEKHGKIIGLIGGLHGFSDFSILKDMTLICATHCTKQKDKIHELYPDTCIKGGVGRVIKI